MSALSVAATGALERGVAGTVVRRDDSAYERIRRSMLWNRLEIGRRPELIVRVASSADVVASLAFAREHGLRVAVRTGGHSWCGAPLRQGSLLLDLGALDTVTVAAAARTATAEPAVTNRALAALLARDRLAFPYGHCPSVALGGFVLAGGFGWNARAWGLACHNLRALDVVLAAGRQLTASADQHADLLWAARGAGPGFCAVATRLHLDLHPLPAAITASRCVYPIEQARAVARWVESVAATLPATLELTLFLSRAPDGSGDVCTVAATAFAETQTAAARALAIFAARPAGDRAAERALLVPASFETLFDGVGSMFAAERRYAADTAWSAAALGDVVDVLAERLRLAPSAKTFFLCAIAPALPSLAAAAFSSAGEVLVNTHAVWVDGADDAVNLACHADTMAALAPLTAGHYVGEADIATAPARAARSFSPASWQRLEALRERYDPGQVLHSWFA